VKGWDQGGAFRTDETVRLAAKVRRDELRALGLCINASLKTTNRAKVVHGEVVQAGRCQRCLDVKRGKAVAS